MSFSLLSSCPPAPVIRHRSNRLGMSRSSRTWSNCCRRDQTCERRSKARFGRPTSRAFGTWTLFLIYLDASSRSFPTEHESSTALKLCYIVNQAPGDQLNRDKSFCAWMKKLAEAWGQFLDTPASASGIPSFVALPNFNIGDYIVEPSGWLTFNQFFAREVKPGKRPIAEPRNDRVIVSPGRRHIRRQVGHRRELEGHGQGRQLAGR